MEKLNVYLDGERDLEHMNTKEGSRSHESMEGIGIKGGGRG